MDEERKRILKMLEDGKISAAEAEKLLDALQRTDTRPSERDLKKKWLHVVVEKNGRRNVNVKVPLSLLRFGFRFAPMAARMKMRKSGMRVGHGHLHAHEDLGERIEGQVRDELSKTLGKDIGEDFDFDVEDIFRLAQEEGFDGKLVDVVDDEEGEHVRVFLE